MHEFKGHDNTCLAIDPEETTICGRWCGHAMHTRSLGEDDFQWAEGALEQARLIRSTLKYAVDKEWLLKEETVKRVPFLNEKGEQVGEAYVNQDGFSAEITVWADQEVLKRIAESDVSIGYSLQGIGLVGAPTSVQEAKK